MKSATRQLMLLSIVLLSIFAQTQTPIRGFADLHNHQFANEGFGGKLMFGKPFSADGNIANAIGWCQNGSHGFGGAADIIGNALGEIRPALPLPRHFVGGYPEFDGWPRWTTKTHQQVYIDWLRRAVDGGLRLMVMHAVNNKVLCGIEGNDGRGCNDMANVDRQIAAAYAMEAYVDSVSPNNDGWYKIVESAAEARQVASQGKLAVVLGIEVDELFNCGAKDGACDDAHIKQELQKYHGMGVRHLFPIHVFNNQFGGAALYNSDFNYGNKIVTGDWFQARDCSNEGYGFNFQSSLLGNVISTFAGAGPAPGYTGSACNTQGLTTLGRGLIKKMMARHMIIDVDHMSALATNDAFSILEPEDFPVAAGHTGFTGISIGAKNSEGEKTDANIAKITQLGGVIAPILHQGKTGDVNYQGASVANDCDESSHSWAQAYLYVKDKIGANAAVGLGSDFNGLAGLPSPRFGSEACAGNGGQAGNQSGGVSYPFTADTGVVMGKSTIGGDGDKIPAREIDYNTDGLAHVGLLPDMLEDLRVAGADMNPIYRSAEAYIAMWEKIEGKNVFPPSSSFNAAPAANSKGWNKADVTVTMDVIENADGFGRNLNYSSIGATAIGSTNKNAFPEMLTVSNEGVSTFSYHAFDDAGNDEATKSGAVRVDKTAPTVNCASPDTNWHAADVALGCTSSDATSQLANGADASFNLTTNVAAGTETATASTNSRIVADNADNSTTVGPYSPIKVDRKAPVITITSPANAVYVINQVVNASYGCTDGGSGVASCAGPVANGAVFNTSGVGNLNFQVNSTDNVNNASQAAVPYKVTYNVCAQFDQTKSHKAGSTIPVKLQICDVNSANLSSAAIVVNAANVVKVSSSASTVVEDSGNANPDNNFRFAGDGYMFNLSTSGLTTGTYNLRFNVAGDPITHTVQFQVR